MKKADLNAALENISEDQEIDLQLLSEENTEGKAEPEIMDGVLSEDETAALEAMAVLLADASDTSGVSIRVAQLCANLVRQSHGLETFGLESDFRVASQEDVDLLIRSIRGENSAGLEGFISDMFKNVKQKSLDRITKIKDAIEEINNLSSNSSSEEMSSSSIKALHFNGSVAIKDIQTGVQNQIQATGLFEKTNKDKMVRYFKDWAGKIVKYLETPAWKRLLENWLERKTGNVYESDASKALHKYMKDNSSFWEDAFRDILFGGKSNRSICGGNEYKYSVDKSKTFLSFLTVGDVVRQIKVVSNGSSPKSNSWKAPSKSELKAFAQDLLKLAEASAIDQDKISLPKEEMEAVYKEIKDKISSGGFRIPFFSDLFKKWEIKDAARTGNSVNSFFTPTAMVIVGQNIRTIDAGVKYINDAIKSYQ